MFHPLCFIKMLWRSLVKLSYVSGCDYEVSRSVHTPENVQVLECTRCGSQSVAWKFTKFEECDR